MDEKEYLIPLRNAMEENAKGGIITEVPILLKSDIEILFANIEKISQLNQQLLADLQAAYSNWPSSPFRLSQIFLRTVCFLSHFIFII